jgi:hypothetical protein
MPARKRPASTEDSDDLDSKPTVTSMAASHSVAASVVAISSVPSAALTAIGASAAPEPLVPETTLAASHSVDASVVASSFVSAAALTAIGASAAPEPLVPSSLAASHPEAAARECLMSPGRGGSVASPPVGSPGRNKQLFMQSVTPQAMTCNLSKLSVVCPNSLFTPDLQVLFCRVSV